MGRGALVLRLAAAFLAGAFFSAAVFFRGAALGLAFLLAGTAGFIAFAISPLLAPRIAMDLTIMFGSLPKNAPMGSRLSKLPLGFCTSLDQKFGKEPHCILKFLDSVGVKRVIGQLIAHNGGEA